MFPYNCCLIKSKNRRGGPRFTRPIYFVTYDYYDCLIFPSYIHRISVTCSDNFMDDEDRL